jgi:dienelactone hydrolase
MKTNIKEQSLPWIAAALFFFLQCALNAQVGDTLLLREGLALPLPTGYLETFVVSNPVEANLVLGKWKAPKLHEKVTFRDAVEKEWQSIKADEKGWFEDSVLSGCYVYLSVEMKMKTVMLLQAMGDEMVYVNEVPRSGNPYGLSDVLESWQPGFDYSWLPVQLERGKNEFLFRCSRGRLKVKLCSPRQPIMFNPRDITIPDFVAGEKIDTWGSIVVVNSTNDPLKELFINASIGNAEGGWIPVPLIQPLSVRKVKFHLLGAAINEKSKLGVKVSLFQKIQGTMSTVDTISIPFRVVGRQENRKETFISGIDESVQYYAINPAIGYSKESPAALFLSLHGASVEAINQSASYYPKAWGHIVAPTNRRPYGFNWEDWGRLDALEAMDAVGSRYAIDENRIYLTGHSMGGHGVWHVGAMFPDKFAAIGPSAGWISFWTYRFRGQNIVDSSEIRRMIRRSTTPSETFQYIDNYKQLGVYVLQGSVDDNVPPDEARSIVERLKGSHKDFIYDEEPGMGHWWDKSDEPGADCVDWAPMFDFFARHARPGKERIREINFLTSNPGVSSKNNWVTIDAQVEQLNMSSVDIRFDPGLKRFVGTTKNVARLALDLDIVRSSDTVSVMLDSQKLSGIRLTSGQQQLWIELHDGKWSVSREPSPDLKNARRYGTFKDVFRNNMVFVFGTKGSREENAWSFSKARCDAEKFWYQGNGSIDVVADVDFNPSEYPDRNVILFGNKNTNAAWNDLLSESPVQVGDGFVKIDKQKFSGDDITCLFVRPKAGSETASVGVIAGTGIVGMRMNNRLPYLSPGFGLPDCTVLNTEVLTKGDKGVLMAGFFGLDWSVEHGEFVRSK